MPKWTARIERTFTGVRWSNVGKAWQVIDVLLYRQLFGDKHIKGAKEAAKIRQAVTFHNLRHSYANGPTHRHFYEAGTDIKLIQELLGHNDLNITLRCTHVSSRTLENIISPFDQLNLG